MNFKVKCTKNVGEEGLTAGKIYEVIDGKITDDYREKRPWSNTNIDSFYELCDFFNYADFVLISDDINFTLNDLKPFMLVERRNGELLIVAENKRGVCFIKKDYSCGCTLEEYDLCLKNIYDCNKDIVKVYDLSKEIAPCFDIKDRALIFNRYKEVFLSLDEIREKFELDKDVAIIIN